MQPGNINSKREPAGVPYKIFFREMIFFRNQKRSIRRHKKFAVTEPPAADQDRILPVLDEVLSAIYNLLAIRNEFYRELLMNC